MTDDPWAWLPKSSFISTRWDDEPNDEWGKRGKPETLLREVCDPIWHDRLIRQGHATARGFARKPELGVPILRTMDEPTYVVKAIEPGWERYAVCLRDGDQHQLDLDKTLAENGITDRHVWVCFVKIEEE